MIVCLEAPDSIYQVLIDRFLARPKPMYYEENFLNSLWQTFKIGSLDTDDKINPDDFMIFGFKALIERRKVIYDMIAKTAKLTSLAKENISIKATTSEGLGRVGDSSGIAVYSLVSLTSL